MSILNANCLRCYEYIKNKCQGNMNDCLCVRCPRNLGECFKVRYCRETESIIEINEGEY